MGSSEINSRQVSAQRAYELMLRRKERFIEYQRVQETTRSCKRDIARMIAAGLSRRSVARIGLLPCDTGVLARELHLLFPRAEFVLVDQNARALAACAESMMNCVRVRLVQSDVENIQFGPILDLAVIHLALHLFRLPDGLVAVRDSLSPRGRLVVVTKTEEQRLAHPMSSFFSLRGAPSVFVCAKPAADLLCATGFAVDAVTAFNRDVVVRVEEIPLVFARNSNSFMRRQSVKGVREFHSFLSSLALRGNVKFRLGYTLLVCRKRCQ